MGTVVRAVSVRPLSLLLALAALLPAFPASVQAQMSPNCERNGRRDHCALTPMPDTTDPRRSIDTLVFADHSVYQLRRNEASCRNPSPRVTTCSATIQTGGRTLAAFYRGTSYEGGYRHDYTARGLRLTYVFLD